MSYYTDYSITASPVNKALVNYIDLALNDTRYGNEMEMFDDEVVSWNHFQDTWYDHTADMLRISRQFPTVLFELRGQGENADDTWCQYFRGGKIQICPIEEIEWPIRPHGWSTAHLDQYGNVILDQQCTEPELYLERMYHAVYQCMQSLMCVSSEAFPWQSDLLSRGTRCMVEFLIREGLPVQLPLLRMPVKRKVLPPAVKEGRADNE